MLKHIAKIVSYTIWITGINKIDKTHLKPPNNFRKTNLKDMVILKGSVLMSPLTARSSQGRGSIIYTQFQSLHASSSMAFLRFTWNCIHILFEIVFPWKCDSSDNKVNGFFVVRLTPMSW